MKNTRIIPLLLLLLLAACTKEKTTSEPQPEAQGGTVNIKLTVPKTLPEAKSGSRATTTYATEDGTTQENYIKEIVVLVFEYKADGTGLLETMQQIPLENLPENQTKWLNESTLIVGNIKDFKKPKNVYVMANWSSATPAFAVSDFTVGTTPETAMKAKMTAISARILAPSVDAPLMMQGGVKNYNFSEKEFKVEVGISRAVAKIRLNISIDEAFKTANPDITVWGETTIGGVHCRTVNVPNRTFVVGRTPSAMPTTADDTDFGMVHYRFVNPAVPQEQPNTWIDNSYVYENPVRGKTDASIATATYIIVHLPYTKNGVIERANYYKVYINNTANTSDPYMVERNYLYDINVVIKGFGMSQELAVPDALTATLTVKEWVITQFNTRLEDLQNAIQVPIVIPPWDITYIGSKPGGNDDNQTPGNGSVLPWDPNDDGVNFPGANPGGGDENQTPGDGSILPWDPNGDGATIPGKDNETPGNGSVRPWDPNDRDEKL